MRFYRLEGGSYEEVDRSQSLPILTRLSSWTSCGSTTSRTTHRIWMIMTGWSLSLIGSGRSLRSLRAEDWVAWIGPCRVDSNSEASRSGSQ